MEEIDADQRIKLDALDGEYRARHGAAVELVKRLVGEGDHFENQVARAVISPNGAWMECVDLPMEFSGAAGGQVGRRFVSEADAIALLERIASIRQRINSGNTRDYGLFALYTEGGIVDGRNVYSCQFTDKGPFPKMREIGEYRPGAMPLVFRVRLDSDLADTGVAFQRGVIFCMAHTGEMNLVVEMPYEADDLRDLSDPPSMPQAQ